MVKNIILSFNAHLYYNKAWLERMDSMPDFIVTPFTFEDLAKVKAHGADSVLIGTPFFLFAAYMLLQWRNYKQ